MEEAISRELRDIKNAIIDTSNSAALNDVKRFSDITDAINQLTHQIKLSSESSDRLGRKIWWLNFAIFFATSAGVIVTLLKELEIFT